jgi:hypothetical protein
MRQSDVLDVAAHYDLELASGGALVIADPAIVHGPCMSTSAIRVVLPAAIALCATYLPDTALAADIASVIGPVSSGAWGTACGLNEDEPNGTSQLPDCPGGGATCLHRVVLDPVEFPEATCSDGTPGVFYVREGTDDPNRWVIHLQGGGNCRDYEECLKRWCGKQGLLPYTANKMSSDWNGDGVTDVHAHVVGPGMASANPDNEFSTWTHVWAYYCSSDNWQGTESDVEFSDGLGGSFALDARGRTILHAMRNMLRKNNSDINWTAEGNNPVPDLDHATEIVFTGTSAGGQGAMANADWFLAPFSGKDNSLVVDAQFEIDDWITVVEDIRVDTDLDGAGDDWWASVMIEMILDLWDVGGYYDLIDGVHDASCMDSYYEDGRMDRCDIAPLLFLLNNSDGPMIATPTFVRLDLEDEVLSRVYRTHPNDMGTSLHVGPGFGAPQTTMDDYARMARASLLMAYDDHDSVTGLFAPRCGDHVGLEDNNAFAVVTTPDTDDVTMVPVPNSDTTMHDALWEWLNVGGGGTRNDVRYLDTDAPGGSNSGC